MKSVIKKLLLTTVLFTASASHSAFADNADCDTRDQLKQTVLKDKYRHISCFYEGLAVVSRDSEDSFNGVFGFIDKTGQLAIPMQYTFAREFREGLALVSQGESQYFIDKKGNTVIDLSEYDKAWSFDNGLAGVSKDDPNGNPFLARRGLIDKTGKVVIPLEYTEITDFRHGRALALKISDKSEHAEHNAPPNNDINLNSEIGMIDLQNHIHIPFDYGHLSWIDDKNILAVKGCNLMVAAYANREYAKEEIKHCRYGVITINNDVVIPFDYQYLEPSDDGGFTAIKDGKKGKINWQNQITKPFVSIK